jgi:hypothetical protein
MVLFIEAFFIDIDKGGESEVNTALESNTGRSIRPGGYENDNVY